MRTKQASGFVPLHRWFNAGNGDHFYCTDPNGKLAPEAGYKYEGITGWVRPSL